MLDLGDQLWEGQAYNAVVVSLPPYVLRLGPMALL